MCENTPELVFTKAEDDQNPVFRNQIKDKNIALHRNIARIVVNESHIVETWTGKRYSIHNILNKYGIFCEVTIYYKAFN